MINITCFWPFGAILGPFGPFFIQNLIFLPRKHKVLLGQSGFRQRRKLRGRWIIAFNYRNFGISMEEEERRRLHPVKSKKINLMKKDVLASKKSKEAEKQLKTIALQRPCSVQLERIKIQNLLSPSQISSIFGQQFQRRSTPTKKETIKDLVRMIKSEPEENTNKAAAPGIRMLLEKTHRRRCAFFFFSICLSS